MCTSHPREAAGVVSHTGRTHRHLLARRVSAGIAIRDTRAPLLHQPPIVRAEKLIEL